MNANDCYFVMLTTQDGNSTPMMGANGEMRFADSVERAKKLAEDTVLGSEFGYEIFELGGGEFSK